MFVTLVVRFITLLKLIMYVANRYGMHADSSSAYGILFYKLRQTSVGKRNFACYITSKSLCIKLFGGKGAFFYI